MVLPFLARTTSPGLFAFPLGMFSQRGAKPEKREHEISLCVNSYETADAKAQCLVQWTDR